MDSLRTPVRFVFFFLTALVLTSPLARYLLTHLPLGTETAATVPLFNLWTLIWNAQSLLHGYAGYWNASIFYPEIGAFTLSDPQPLFFAFEALFRFGKTPDFRAALTLGWWTAATYLTSSYYVLFLALSLPLGGIIFAQREHFQPRALLNLATGMALAGSLLLPILFAQTRWTQEYTRSERTIKDNCAQGADYLRLDGQMWGNNMMPWMRTPGGSGQKLYPGTGLLALGAVGVIFGWRKHPRRVLFCLSGALVAFGMSFGLNLDLEGRQPYSFLRDYIPGFAQLRSPFRIAVFVQIFLLGLAGSGVSYILRQNKSTIAKGLVILFGLVSLVEVAAFPTRLWSDPALLAPPDWVNWLGTQPDGVVAMIPFSSNGRPQGFEPTAMAMVLSLRHGKPLVNGYSGFFPRSYREMSAVMEKFPDEESLIRLEEAGVRYLVIDPDWLTIEREAILFNLGLKLGFEGEEKTVLINI